MEPLRRIDFAAALRTPGGSPADADYMSDVAYRANPQHGLHPIDFARHYGTRLLTADFAPGDVRRPPPPPFHLSCFVGLRLSFFDFRTSHLARALIECGRRRR